ncbi:asparagine synthase (glutamine-hydrolyzing) [Myxococcota bacterium]|nr:asparagine synthase (glutamine-hydrolyzing) [Myxococcota bacterium]
MCGIVGYAGRAPLVTRQRLVHMRDQLRHRGPDDAGIYLHARGGVAVGLAHRRLSILDTREIGRQPMSLGTLHLIFNGEIYNFKALRLELEAQGHTFQTETDTEVLLHLYQARGIGMLDALNGMFSLALWDERKRALLLARDRLGIKPLYYAELPQGLLFGSEPKALLASKLISDALDLQAHHDYLALNYTPGPRSAWRDVRKLQPGEAMIWTPEGQRRWRYWSPVAAFAAPRRPAPTFDEAAEEALSDLRAATRRRMIADVPLGMFLSGGIDSTAVLMCMSEVATAPIKAFTIAFEEDSYDESAHAAVAARAFGARHYVEVVRPEPEVFLGPLTEAFDEPYADSSAIPLWYLSRLARQHVTVALGGDGGDEVLAGYRTHTAWRLAQLYRQLPARLRDELIPSLAQRLPVSHDKISFDLKARAFSAAAALPPVEAHYGFKAFLSESARRALLGEAAMGLEDSVARFQAVADEAGLSGLSEILNLDQQIYLPDDILLKVDRMSMIHGLEARVPFLDHQLVEALNALPADYKLRGLTTKALLKRALRRRAPAQILTRGKAGFNVPMARWLLGPLRALSRDMLSPSSVQRLGLWEPKRVTALLDAHERREADHSRPIWAMLSFMLFNERFRRGRAA